MALLKNARVVNTSVITDKEGVPLETTMENAITSNKANSSSVFPSTHVVRMNVIGFAGILVDDKYKNPGKKKIYPRPPDKMRAVVAVSRGEYIQATTPLSKPLSRPNSSVSPGIDSPQQKCRLLALWGSDDNSTLGSSIEFEVSLDRLDIGDCRESTSQYIPKNFELTAALTEGTEHERKIALPIGIANLLITGNTSSDVLSLDLPILSLEQANPIADDQNGLRGFQMMSIHDKAVLFTDKRKNLGRLLGRNTVDKNQNMPSIADRKLFSSVYSTDASGDAILRVQLQVIEKPTHEEVFVEQPQEASYSRKLEPQSSEATEGTESIETLSFTSDASREIVGHDSITFQITKVPTDKVEPNQLSAMRIDQSPDSHDPRLRQSFTATTEPTTTFTQKSERRRSRRAGCFENFQSTGCGSFSYPDELTMVTGEVFNREFRFPICSTLKEHLVEEETFVSDSKETFHTYTDLERTKEGQNRLPNKSFFSTFETKDIKDKLGRVLARAEKFLCGNPEDWNDDQQGVAGVNSLDEMMDGVLFDGEPQLPLASSDVLTMPSVHKPAVPVSHPSAVRPLDSALRMNSTKKRDEQRPKAGTEADDRPASTIKKPIATSSLFPFTNPSKTCWQAPKRTYGISSNMDVPKSLEIPEIPNSDDLTAITANEFKTLQRNRQTTKSRFPTPWAFGFFGLCSNIHLVDDDREIVRGVGLKATKDVVAVSSSSSQTTEVTAPVRENYFEDYDHYSIDRPQSLLSEVPCSRKDVI